MLTNKTNISLPLATWLASNSYGGKPEPKRLSATSLLQGTRKLVYQELINRGTFEESSLDISELLASKLGSAIHQNIQNVWEDDTTRSNALLALGIKPEVISKIKVNPSKVHPGDIPVYFEVRTNKVFNDWTISGQFDMVYDGQIQDFKSTSTYVYMKNIKKDDYIKQLSIYKWLNPELITEDTGVIHYIFKNWDKNKVHEEGYPQTPFVSVTYELLPLHEVQKLITSKIMDIEACLEYPNMLPDCDNKDLMIHEDVYQYFSSESSVRASKNFDNLAEANKYLASKGKGLVKKKMQEPKGCYWCNCRGVCTQYKRFKELGVVKE